MWCVSVGGRYTWCRICHIQSGGRCVRWVEELIPVVTEEIPICLFCKATNVGALGWSEWQSIHTWVTMAATFFLGVTIAATRKTSYVVCGTSTRDLLSCGSKR